MYLLDTNICVALIKEHPSALEKFKATAKDCYLPTLVVAELYKGAYCSQKVESNVQTVEKFLSIVGLVEFDPAAAREFGIIQGELRRMGRPTGEIDALIAAMARSRNAVLVTNNIKDFQNIVNLKIEDWLAA
jgi:tRNA(fMet)-specific endonuclease VapC